jgi:RimJ/RimL family protein N-acetyltransferase
VIDQNLKDKIFELESENMPAILEASGIIFEPRKLLENLNTEQKIVTVILSNKLMALLRYKVEDNQTAFILSIQIRNPANNKSLMFPLIKKALKSFEEENIEQITSVVQKSNVESKKLNLKLGLEIDKEFEKAIRFRGDINTLKKLFKF